MQNNKQTNKQTTKQWGWAWGTKLCLSGDGGNMYKNNKQANK